MMKQLSTFTALALAAFAAQARTYTFLPTAGNTEETAYEWTAPENWQDGECPMGESIDATIAGAAFAGTADIHVKFPEAGLTLGHLRFEASKCSIYFHGGRLTLKDASGNSTLSGSWATSTYPYFDCDVDVQGGLAYSARYRGRFLRGVSFSGTTAIENMLELDLKDRGFTSETITDNLYPCGDYVLSNDGALNIFAGSYQYRQTIGSLTVDANGYVNLTSTQRNETLTGESGAMVWLDVTRLAGSRTLMVGTDRSYNCNVAYAGTLRVHDLSAFTGKIQTPHGRLWFYRNADGTDPVLSELSVSQGDWRSTDVIKSRVCIPESATTLTVNTLVLCDSSKDGNIGELVKFGPGALKVIDYAPDATNTQITVEGGAISLGKVAGGEIRQPRLTMASGTTLDIPAGVTLHVGTASLSGTVTVTGGGVLQVDVYEVVPDVLVLSGAVSVAGGETVEINSMTSSSGRLAKNGAGTLKIQVLEAQDVEVNGGTLIVQNDSYAAEAVLPADMALHLDATQARFDYLFEENGTNFIGRWKDVRENGGYEIRCRSSAKKKLPWLREKALNGLPVVDFGALGPDPYVAGQRVMMQVMKAPTTTYNNDTGTAALPDATATYQVFGSEYGGNVLFDGPAIGDNKLAPRDRANSTAAVVNSDSALMAANGVFSINGQCFETASQATLSGAFDLVAWRQSSSGASGVQIAALAYSGHLANRSGGQLLGEVIVCTNAVTETQHRKIQSYLHKKWFGSYFADARPSTFGTARIAAGAELALVGEPMTVTSFGGAGTLAEGTIRLADGGVVEVVVNDDGTLGVPSVGSAAAFAALGGGTVKLVGNVAALVDGRTPVVAGENVTFAEGSTWELVVDGETKKRCSLKMVAGRLVVSVASPGFLLLIR